MSKKSFDDMNFEIENIDNELLIKLYKDLLKPRMVEEKMLVLLRKGKISKWFSGIGQEAISVGAVNALHADEYVLPLHRNLGVFTTREVALERLFAQFQGKKTGFSKGRERSFHFGINEHHIVGMISHLGPQLSVGSGIALAYLLKNEPKVSLAFSGEGGTSEGEFHEALNTAAVWDLPIIFVIENNGYGLSTPISEQFSCEYLADKAKGYGMEGITIDGNDVIEVYQTIHDYAESIRKNPRPVLIECMTFRMRGHEEASGTKYVPEHLFEEWKQKDPVVTFEKVLLEQKIISEEDIQSWRESIAAEIDQALKTANQEPPIAADEATELADVYAPHEAVITEAPKEGSKQNKRLIDAISDGLRLSMEKFPECVIMGQDVAEYGGVFKITEGFLEQFGKERVRNTPLCESAILGIGLGLSVKKMKAVVEMQFADFVSVGFNQIVNNLAKIHYRWGQNADVVVRMPTGAGVGAGPFHSQSNEAWFVHTPGLKVVYPATPYDAKGLLAAAIEDPNPVLFFEHKALYRSVQQEIPDDYYTLPIGEARVVSRGEDLAIITYGAGVHWVQKYMEENTDHSIYLVDLRSLLPWDKAAVEAAVEVCGKVLVLHEDTLTGGIGGEIAAYIGENCFEHLDGPVKRLAALDTPVPFAKNLEAQFLPQNRLKATIEDLMDY